MDLSICYKRVKTCLDVFLLRSATRQKENELTVLEQSGKDAEILLDIFYETLALVLVEFFLLQMLINLIGELDRNKF